LQEQVTYLSEQLQQAGLGGNVQRADTPSSEKGKEKTKAADGEKEISNSNTRRDPDDPAEQLRQRRLLRFSKDSNQ